MKKAILPLTLLALFILFTILVKTVDVSAIGPLGSKVGFATLNGMARDLIGQNAFCYSLTKILGLFAILTVALEALYGIAQVAKRKSLFKADRKIITLGIVYFALFVCYAAFEKLALNFRPVLEDSKLAASYPSSHTMLIVTVFGCTYFFVSKALKNAALKKAIMALCIIFCIVAVIGRLLSGVHWLTDIAGGLLISCFFISVYKKSYAAV